MKILELLQKRSRAVEKSLDQFLPVQSHVSKRLAEAMRYSVFSGGKRVRPFLVLEASRVCGGSEKKTLPLACAMEMIHTYSLVHDDLPDMDDDDYRRGRPTCHKRFDPATAILVGDALLSHAFQVMSEASHRSNKRLASIIHLVSEAIGPYGMVGGQELDLKYRKSLLNLKTLSRINRFKTGALIKVCLEAGALWAGGSRVQVHALGRYGESVGFLFQNC